MIKTVAAGITGLGLLVGGGCQADREFATHDSDRDTVLNGLKPPSQPLVEGIPNPPALVQHLEKSQPRIAYGAGEMRGHKYGFSTGLLFGSGAVFLGAAVLGMFGRRKDDQAGSADRKGDGPSGDSSEPGGRRESETGPGRGRRWGRGPDRRL